MHYLDQAYRGLVTPPVPRREVGITRTRASSSLLLVICAPLRRDEEGRLMVEGQAANGLERWADNFETIKAACVVSPDSELRARSSMTWRRVDDLACADRVEVIPLPWAYKPALFMRHYRPVRTLMRSLIEESEYLVFGIGSLWGDWAALGGLEAIRQRRPYAVWTDMVDHQVIRLSGEAKPVL